MGESEGVLLFISRELMHYLLPRARDCYCGIGIDRLISELTVRLGRALRVLDSIRAAKPGASSLDDTQVVY